MNKAKAFATLLLLLTSCAALAKGQVDFIHYKARLTPNFPSKSVAGKVEIEFSATADRIRELVLSAKYKEIRSVVGDRLGLSYRVDNDALVITFDRALIPGRHYRLDIAYRATPELGMKFHDDHLFTFYHTGNWLVSHEDIADKASFELLLTHDKDLIPVGNGKLVETLPQGSQRILSHWLQQTPIPVYAFGFALGAFERIGEHAGDSDIAYFYRKASDLSEANVKSGFRDVSDMIAFFQNKAGFSLTNRSYQYVLVEGYKAQEASGFSLVGEEFLRTLLKDENENWFVAHELAHEWWGNSITCADFAHFWLNEGLVQFLVAAYKEHRFGVDAYQREIGLAVDRVKRAVNEHRAGPVAFKHPLQERDINRTMVYSKGALVFHLLRNELGDKLFWQALRSYSSRHKGGSVTTEDLKQDFEAVSGKDLSGFFERWVYGPDIPEIRF